MKPIHFIIVFCVLMLGLSEVVAQACEELQPMMEAVYETCLNLERNQLCVNGEVSNADTVTDFSVGDGIALARLQGDYADGADDSISVVFVGDLDLQNAVASSEQLPPRIPVTVGTDGSNANVRVQPSTDGELLTSVGNNVELVATGRTEDSSWLRIQLPEDASQAGWVFAELIDTEHDVSVLDVVSADDPAPVYPEFAPMQDFNFTATSSCAGVLIQSAEEDTRVRVNGATLVLLEGTVFVQGGEDAMTIYGLEGNTVVQTDDALTLLIPGSQTQLQLEAGIATGEPGKLEGYDEAALQMLVGDYLARPVEIAPAASGDAIRDVLLVPLSGTWRIEYPAFTATGDGCNSYSVPADSEVVTVRVRDSGDSYIVNEQFTAIRTAPGNYGEGTQVITPGETSTTYDAAGGAACEAIITVVATWIGY